MPRNSITGWGPDMPLEAAGLALVVVAVFLLALVGLEAVESRFTNWRAARALLREVESDSPPKQAGQDPPRQAGRY